MADGNTDWEPWWKLLHVVDEVVCAKDDAFLITKKGKAA